jgi:hypothetical protein
MSISEEREILLSQLVDGELPADQANEVLADVLDDSESSRQLKAMLRLRRALGPWRRQEPVRAVVALPPAQPGRSASQLPGRVMSLAAAAVLGGVLVAGGFYMDSRLGRKRSDVPIARQPEDAAVPQIAPARHQPVLLVTSDERREIARAFALHESVAGPLSWYAADDATIQVAPAQKGEKLQQPVAVVLRLSPDQCSASDEAKTAKTYVIVCRGSDATALELPSSAGERSLRLRLLSREIDGQVNLQYVLAATGSDQGRDDAALAGRRHLGLGQTSLGQLAMNDCLVNVDASAWVIRDQRKP